MKRTVFDYFHFSRTERQGAILLASLCAAVFLLPEIFRLFYQQPETNFSAFASEVRDFHNAVPADNPTQAGGEPFPFNPNTAGFDDFVRMGLPGRVARSICNYREKGGVFYRPEDFAKIYTLAPADFERLRPFIRLDGPAGERPETFAARGSDDRGELFDFDPNTASAADLRRLGLSDRLVSNILKYREKGGRFRVREDFGKLYGLSAQDYARLEPHIFLPVAQSGPAPRPVSYAATGGGGARSLTVDINAASLDDWQRLPGIGAPRARQIVYFRDKLGGFASVAQVAETRGLPDSIFQKIQPFLQLGTPVFRRINLNTATAEELDGHVYISRKQADLIVRYREQHGAFGAVDDLKKIAAFKDGVWVAKVKPYLTAE